MSIATSWGTTEAERALPYPCDSFVTRVDAACWRGVSVHADAAAVFRWLCQLRVAAYSYDIQTINDPAGGVIAGFPPVPGANLDGGDMRLTGPGVGVYLEFTFPTAWLGLVDRHAYQVHVFSAAQAVEVQP